MAKKISGLTAASAAAAANEFEINEAGTSKKVTGAQIKTFVSIGTTTNDNAAAGQVGEVIESTVLAGSAVSLTSGAGANVTSISLTAGDWDVWAAVGFSPNAATTITFLASGIATTSATLPTNPGGGASVQLALSWPTGSGQVFPVGARRISVGSTTTVYLVAQANFGVNTMAAYGYLGARRVR